MNIEITIKTTEENKYEYMEIKNLVFKTLEGTELVIPFDGGWSQTKKDSIVYHMEAATYKEENESQELTSKSIRQNLLYGELVKISTIPENIQNLEVEKLVYDYVYNFPSKCLCNYQYVDIDITDKQMRLTGKQYEELANIVRANDRKETAENILDNCDYYSENIKELLKRDSEFPEFIEKELEGRYTGQDESDAIYKYLNRTYGGQVSAVFISNKGTDDEIHQTVSLPESIMKNVINDLERYKNGEEKPDVYPEFFDEDYDIVSMKYVDEIIMK